MLMFGPWPNPKCSQASVKGNLRSIRGPIGGFMGAAKSLHKTPPLANATTTNANTNIRFIESTPQTRNTSSPSFKAQSITHLAGWRRAGLVGHLVCARNGPVGVDEREGRMEEPAWAGKVEEEEEEVDLLADFNTSPDFGQLEPARPMRRFSHQAETTQTLAATGTAQSKRQVWPPSRAARGRNLVPHWGPPNTKGPINGGSVIHGIDQDSCRSTAAPVASPTRGGDRNGKRHRTTTMAPGSKEVEEEKEVNAESENGACREPGAETGTGTLGPARGGGISLGKVDEDQAAEPKQCEQSISRPTSKEGRRVVSSIEWRYANELVQQAAAAAATASSGWPRSQSGIASSWHASFPVERMGPQRSPSELAGILGEWVASAVATCNPGCGQSSRTNWHELCNFRRSIGVLVSAFGEIKLPPSSLVQLELEHCLCRLSPTVVQEASAPGGSKLQRLGEECSCGSFLESRTKKRQQGGHPKGRQQAPNNNNHNHQPTERAGGSATFLSPHFRRSRLAPGPSFGPIPAESSKFQLGEPASGTHRATELACHSNSRLAAPTTSPAELANRADCSRSEREASGQQTELARKLRKWIMSGGGNPERSNFCQASLKVSLGSGTNLTSNALESGEHLSGRHHHHHRPLDSRTIVGGFAPVVGGSLGMGPLCWPANGGGHLTFRLPLRANVIDLNHKRCKLGRGNGWRRSSWARELAHRKGAGGLSKRWPSECKEWRRLARAAMEAGKGLVECELNSNEGEGGLVVGDTNTTTIGDNGQTKGQKSESTGEMMAADEAILRPHVGDATGAGGSTEPAIGRPQVAAEASSPPSSMELGGPQTATTVETATTTSGSSHEPAEATNSQLSHHVCSSLASSSSLAGDSSKATWADDEQPKRLLEPPDSCCRGLMIDRSCATSNDKSGDECDAISRSAGAGRSRRPDSGGALRAARTNGREQATSGPETHANWGNSVAGKRLGPPSWLLLLLCLSILLSGFARPAAQAGASAAPTSQQLRRANHEPTGGGKLGFWRQLVGSALSDVGADNNKATLERLARKLNEWPDQRQAALFYLDLVARKQNRMTRSGIDGDKSTYFAGADLCQRASLAELVADGQHPGWSALAALELSSPEGALASGGWSAERTRQLVELNELNSGTTSRALLAKVEHEPRFVAAAGLAVDVSNLISRLLVHPESEVIRRIASPKFFRYLLESKLRQLSPDLPELHSAGLVFCDGLEENATRPTPGGQQQLDSPAAWAPQFAPLAVLTGSERQPSVLGLDLAAHQVAGSGRHPNGYFGLRAGGGMQPFLAKWLPANNLEQLAPMERRLSQLLNDQWATNNSQQATANSLKPGDGRWFSPYLDCGLSNRWLISYSIPFFASNTKQEPDDSGGADVKFRGVSFVSLDFGRLKLVDQCAKEQGPAFLANTNRCARLQRSQCLRLNDVEDVRSGAYICQCPAGGSVVPAERRATELYRDKLASLIIGGNSTSSALDQLILEPDERLGDKSRIAASLFKGQQPNVGQLNGSQIGRKNRTFSSTTTAPSRYFALGAQFDTDAALEWFTSVESSSSFAPNWPAQTCRICLQQPEAAQVNSNNQTTETISSSSSNFPEQNGSNLASCLEFHTSASFTWIRPMVATFQLVCILLTLALIGILLRVRKSRIILVSGWLMLGTLLVGALLLYTSVLVHYFEPTSVTCLLEPWLRELGFSIFYGSILIKLYRILTEFQTRKAHRVCFRDKDQIVYLLAIVLIVVGYMSAWTALMVDGFFFGHQAAAAAASSNHNQQPSSEDDYQSARGRLSGWPQLAGQPAKEPQADFGATSGELADDAGRMGPNSGTQLEIDEGQQFERQQHHLDQVHLNGGQAISSFSLLNYSVSGLEVGSKLASAVDQLAEFAPEQLKNFARNFNSFADIFSGLVETQAHYDQGNDSLTYSMRCRKLTWDYVTELSEMTLLVFGIYLIYKLRNASSEVHKEKLVLCIAVFIELLASGFTYMIRHFLWNQISSEQILLLYFGRCQLTVTVILALVFGPKLWTIGKSKPTLFSLSGNRTTGGSMRHRCHISCEIHDHHLNDAMRLHQAMLSNAALDIGSINLADMDPDEIQAELKRVYAQLEVLKTKVMRRDNPHISKRRGGRKTGHRKFSLQAFHAKHHLTHHNSISSNSQQQQQRSNESTPYVSCSESVGPQTKLPTVVEQESSVNLDGCQQEVGDGNAGSEPPAPLADDSNLGKSSFMNKENNEHLHQQNKRRHHNHHHHHHHQQNDRKHGKPLRFTKGNHQHSMGSGPDPASTSSTGVAYYDDDTLILNDSQSSGNASPPRRSSYACSQSSIHPEDSSLN